MKNIFIIFSLIFSATVFGQIKFKNPDVNNLRSLKTTQENHHLILRTYRKQIDSEISRLVVGIEYETNSKGSKFKVNLYQNLLAHLLIKRIFLTELDKQLKAVDIDAYVRRPQPRKPLFNTDGITINLEKEIGIHLDSVVKKESVSHFFLNDLKANLVKSTLKTIAVKTYQSVGTGLLTKIIANGMTASAFKSVVISMGSKVFISAGTATLLTILTIPLMGRRLPPETIWIDILKENPELIINPEWMKYAKSYDDPWYSHAYAILRRTSSMERAFNTLMTKEESEFQSSVRSISKMQELKKEKTDFPNRPYINQPDGTYVRKPVYLDVHLPFWAYR